MTPEAIKDRAKRIIVELVRQAGGVFYNKTNLYKAFWRAHLAYAETNPGYLSAWPIVKMPEGPGIDRFNRLCGEMLEDGWLDLREQQSGPHTGMVFDLGETPPPCALDKNAVAAIRAGVAVAGKWAATVSDESHRDSRAWNQAAMGKELDVYSDLLSNEELAELDKGLESLAAAAGYALSDRTKMSVNPVG